jgi:glycosyltransferase involved in cell wall biosynthesis
MVSVVLSTQGASDRLSRSLRALFAQSYPAERYEVLVVHAGSDERLQHSRDEVVDRDQERLHLVSAAGLNAPAIRNTGLRRATGTVVAFTDDGCEVAPGWIEAGILGFERNVAVVTGPIKVTQGERPGLLDRAGGPQVAGALYPARNVFYRRDAALDAGGFDESFQPSAAGDRFWGWDSDLAWRLQRQGYEGRFRDAYAYVKPARSEFTPGLVQAWQIANATPRLVRAIPELRRHLLVGTVLYSWDNLAFKLGVLGTLLALGSRRTAWLLLWIPRVSRAIAIAGGDRWPPHRWPWLVGKVAILLALDTVSAVGLVRGSARARSVVL